MVKKMVETPSDKKVILRLEDLNTNIARRWLVEGVDNDNLYDIINPDKDNGDNGDLEDIVNATLDGGGFLNEEKLWELGYSSSEVVGWRELYGEIIKRLKSAGCVVKRIDNQKVD